MRHNLNLNWLRSFEATARHLSFTRASQELGLTQTAVSQHIKALEQQLGQLLFVRRPRSLQMTDIGQAYLASVRDALGAIEMSTSGLFGPNLQSTVVIRASLAFQIWLSPSLAQFQKQHPGIGIKLVTSIWDAKTDPQPIDLEIVLASNRTARSEMQHLSDERIVPVCGASRAGKVRAISDLPDHDLIHILGFEDHWIRYLAAFGVTHDTSSPQVMVDTSVAAMELVAADIGCAVMIERFANQAVATGRRIKIVGEPVQLEQSHYLLRGAAHQKIQPAVETFATWLRARLQHEP